MINWFANNIVIYPSQHPIQHDHLWFQIERAGLQTELVQNLRELAVRHKTDEADAVATFNHRMQDLDRQEAEEYTRAHE